MATTTVSETIAASAKITSKGSSKQSSAKVALQEQTAECELGPAPGCSAKKSSSTSARTVTTLGCTERAISDLSEGEDSVRLSSASAGMGSENNAEALCVILSNGDEQETEAKPEQPESVKDKSEKTSVKASASKQISVREAKSNTTEEIRDVISSNSKNAETNKSVGALEVSVKKGSKTSSTPNTSATNSSTKSKPSSIFRSRRTSSAVDENPAEGIKEEESVNNEQESIIDAWSQEEVNKVVGLWELTSAETEHLVELGEGLKDIEHWKNCPKEVVRFMKARPKSTKAAASMFRKMVQWRIDNDVDTILQDYEPPRLIRDYMPGAVLVDYDKEGDPIYAERIGSADSPEMVHRFGAEHLIKHAIWIREKISNGKWVKDYEKKNGRPVRQICVVEDLQGLSMAHLDRKLLSAFQAITRLDQDNYPEVAKKLININAPFIFRMAWSLVKHFFDPNVAEKMVFASASSTEKVLSEYMDLKALPREMVPQGEGKAAPGLPPNFKGGPLPPFGSDDEDSFMLSANARKETASESSSSFGEGDRQSRSFDSETVHSGHSSLWSGPVRTYLREIKVKRNEKKEQEVREIREIAARRLQPKELSSSQRARLSRLREAKIRRTHSDDGSSVGGPSSVGAASRGSEPDHNKSLSLKVTDQIQMQDRKTRFLVMASLISLLFILLNPELLEITFGITLIGETSKVWWVAILEGLGLLLYTMMCAMVHFLTCDISLVYAFNVLDIGHKAGRELKKFYSDNVRLAVLAVSFGIFVLSFGQAFARVIFTVAMSKTTSMLWSLSGTITSLMSRVIESVGDIEDTTSPRYDFNTSMGIVVNEECASRTVAVQAAHEIAESAQRAAEKAKEHMSGLTQLVLSSVEVGRVDEVVSSWRCNAFQTARLFFSYTAVFLLVFLVLFNYTASSALSKTKPPHKSTKPQTPQSVFNGTPPSSPTDASRESEDGGEDHTVHSEVSSVADSTDDSPGKRQLRKFRLFKKRAHRPVLGAVKESEESTEMQMGVRAESS